MSFYVRFNSGATTARLEVYKASQMSFAVAILNPHLENQNPLLQDILRTTIPNMQLKVALITYALPACTFTNPVAAALADDILALKNTVRFALVCPI